jgi:hypothetical protein
VSPEAPETIAVVRSTAAVASNRELDLAVFDGAVMRPQTFAGVASARLTTFQWDTGARIFGVNSSTTEGSAFQVAVDAAGLQLTASQTAVTDLDDDAFLVGGRILMQRGRVFDPLTFAQLGAFALGGPLSSTELAPDLTTGKAFFLMNDGVKSFDLQTLAPLASITIPEALPSRVSSALYRWGPDGLVLLNYMHPSRPGILLLQGPFVQP